MLVHLDFETLSLCGNVKTMGSWGYAEDITTKVICLVYEVEGEVRVWLPGSGKANLLYKFAADPGAMFVAHNAPFEQAIWHHHMVEKLGFPEIPIERWDCTMAACAWKGYPLALENAARVLGIPQQKDKEGNKITLAMSKASKKTGELPALDEPTSQRIIQYCKKDVEAEVAIADRIGLISQESEAERQIWILDQKINQRGLRIDIPFVEQAMRVVAKAKVPLLAEFKELTGGVLPGSQKLLGWCADQGVFLGSLQADRLEEVTDGKFELPENVRRVLDIRMQLSATAIAKLPVMLEAAGYDGRIRGLFQYHGAHSGRWAGRLIQPQNLPRESAGEPEAVVDAIMSGDPKIVEERLGLPALEAVARAIRHAIVPAEGKVFQVGDYKAIEAVVLLALAGHHDLAKQLAEGAPVYMQMAEMIFNQEPGTWTNPEFYKHYKEVEHVQEYTIGKNTVLGCGFQMGAAKFLERYCRHKTEEFAQGVVDTYRKKFAPLVPELWYDMQRSSLQAMKCIDLIQMECGVTWGLEDGFMVAHLPNGWQKLWYPEPRMGVDPKFDQENWTCKRWDKNVWKTVHMYGGLETENVVQALARGILCHALKRMDEAGLDVVMTTHDEIVCEVDEDKADLLYFSDLMAERPKWVENLQIPVAVESWSGSRYKK